MPLIMIGFAFAGRMPRRMFVLSGALFIAIVLQYPFTELCTSGVPELAVLHVVNAAVILYLSLALDQ